MSTAVPNAPSAGGALAISGERLSGASVREFNSKAAQTLSNLLKSSLGPLGLDKMMIDKTGDSVHISNDGATILSLLDVGHPAARILVELAKQQDEDVGDGTTSVVILAAELVKRANDLIRKQRLHPTTVIAGLRLACKEATRYVEDQLSFRSEHLGKHVLLNCALTTLASKVIGGGADGDFFAQLAVDAILNVRTLSTATSNASTSTNVATAVAAYKYPVKAVNILKAHGKSALESQLVVNGFALNCTVACEGMPKALINAKIACLDMNLQRQRMHNGITVLIDDPAKLEAVRKREISHSLERVQAILKAGANVVLTTKGIDDLCLKQFVEAKCMAVRRVRPEDLRRIAKACGATVVTTMLSEEEGNTNMEQFDAAWLGSCEAVAQERFGDDECIVLKGTKAHPSSSVVLRGPNEQMLEEMERSLHDALCVLKRVLETGTVVCGGGCVESALSVFLENFATTIASKEQLAVAEFGEALLVIPKTLAMNAGLDGTELVAKLRSRHYAAQSALSVDDPRQQMLRCSGLNLAPHQTSSSNPQSSSSSNPQTSSTSLQDVTETNAIQDNLAGGILEPAIIKVRALQSATEAAVALLRIDDFIKVIAHAEH